MTLKQHPSLTLLPDRSVVDHMGTAMPLQRRSVPDINAPVNSCGSGGSGAGLQLFPQMKRNSYQGDHRMVSWDCL